MMSRRTALGRLCVLTGLIAACRASAAFAGPAGKEALAWIDEADRLGGGLRGQTVSVSDWREGLKEVFARVALADVLRDIDFDRLVRRTAFAELGVATVNVRFGGETRRLSFFPKAFAVGKGRAIIPHGHANMVSAHLPLSGRLLLRQYDQVGRDGDALLIRPSLEAAIGPGDLSSIGEDADNVHWFVAEEPSWTLDLIVTGLDPAAPRRYEIFNIDIENAAPEGGGLLRAPRMGVAEALAKYG